MLFKKNNTPQLDMEEASKILSRTFEAAGMEPNTTPLDILASYSNYRKERFTTQRTILVIIMTLFLLLPLLFVPSQFTLSLQTPSQRLNPIYRLQVDTFMLVQRITATIDGHSIPVVEVDSHVYSVEPTRNGQMDVTVTLINNQTLTHSVDVSGVDLEVPVVTASGMENGNVYLYLSDTGSGVDYESITASDPNGNDVPISSYDAASGRITFDHPQESLNVFIPDKAKNTLHLILSFQ